MYPDKLLILSITILSLIMLFIYLSKCVIDNRRKYRVAYSHAVDEPCFQASISAHRNFVEYTPLSLILLSLLASLPIHTLWFATLCLALLCGRVLHALGMLIYEQQAKPNFLFRISGMTLTALVLLCSALSLLVSALMLFTATV